MPITDKPADTFRSKNPILRTAILGLSLLSVTDIDRQDSKGSFE